MAERANDHHSARLLVAMAPAACQYQSPDHTALLASGSRCEDAQTSPDSLPETTALNDADVVFGACMDDWCLDELPALENPRSIMEQDMLDGAVEALFPVEKPSKKDAVGVRVTKPSGETKAKPNAALDPRPRGRASRKKITQFKSTCERRKDEIASLRREASELQDTIERLKGLAGGVTSALAHNQAIASTHSWQTHAQHRLRKLQQATRENARLWCVVRKQKKSAKGLQRMLRVRVERATHLEYGLLPLLKCLELGGSSDDNSVYAKLLAATDNMKAETDGNVRMIDMRVPDGGNGSFRESEVTYFGSQSLLGAHMITSEELPFPKECTSRALQRCLGSDNDGWEYVVQNFGALSGVAMDKRHVRLTTSIELSMYRIRRVRRTFALDSDTSVILLVSYIDPADETNGEPSARGFALLDRKWTLVRQIQSCESPDVTSTLVQTYSTMVPEILSPQYASFWNKEVISSSVIPLWTMASSSDYQQLENLLVDRANGHKQDLTK